MKKDISILKKIFESQGFSREVICSILGNIEVESNFVCTVENMTYSTVERLKEVFSSKFAKKSVDYVKQFVKQPVKLGDYVYSALGGHKYRGRGYIQITGRKNYEYYGKLLGFPLLEKPELASTPEVAALITSAYIKANAFSLMKNINESKDIVAVATLVSKSIQGIGKDYSKGFLKRHLEKKVSASLKYHTFYSTF